MSILFKKNTMSLKNIKVCIHQPDFIPYFGFFNKISKSDIFVIMDNVQLSKSGWTHRDKIKTKHGAEWLTIPLKKIILKQRINEVQISNDTKWKKKHLNLIFENYKESKFYSEIIKIVEEIYLLETNYLFEFNLNAIKIILKLLGIKKEIKYLSKINAKGNKSTLLINILKSLECKIYMSGTGAKDFINLNEFKKYDLKVNFNNFKHPIYNQLHGKFICNLSIIDILFNCGIQKTKEIINND